MKNTKGLTIKQRRLLMEATRRYLNFREVTGNTFKGLDMTNALVGLGTVKEYAPVEEAGFMRISLSHSDNPDNRNQVYWWKLTTEGAAIVKVLAAALTVEQIEKELDR
jgi:hypothetical protein